MIGEKTMLVELGECQPWIQNWLLYHRAIAPHLNVLWWLADQSKKGGELSKNTKSKMVTRFLPESVHCVGELRFDGVQIVGARRGRQKLFHHALTSAGCCS